MFELRAMFVNVGWRPLIILATIIGLLFLVSSTPPVLNYRDILIGIVQYPDGGRIRLVHHRARPVINRDRLGVDLPFRSIGRPLALLLLTRGQGIGLPALRWVLVLLLTIKE
jgi:hypothetical protein